MRRLAERGRLQWYRGRDRLHVPIFAGARLEFGFFYSRFFRVHFRNEYLMEDYADNDCEGNKEAT